MLMCVIVTCKLEYLACRKIYNASDTEILSNDSYQSLIGNQRTYFNFGINVRFFSVL